MRLQVEIIAEVANAHQGDPERAARLAEAALAAGADAVKFQIYSAEELLVRAHPRFEHFQRQSFPPETWDQLLSAVVGRGGRVYCDVFGLKALAVASKAGVYGYKVHSSDLGNLPLLEGLAHTGRRVLLAVGGSTVREIIQALKALASGKGSMSPVLLYGFQSYPTAVEDACLSRLLWLRQVFGDRYEIGYMDHVDGDDPFAVTLPLLALGMGVTVLEKHITFDRAARGVDYYSSLNPDEFAGFVGTVRRAERSLGDSPEEFASAEREYRLQVKKHWVTALPLEAGHVLAPQDVVMKRVENHIAGAVELDKLMGRPLLEDCPEEQPLTRAHVPQTVWAMVVARMRSTRLPGKALLDVGEMSALQHLFERLKQARMVNHIVLCTTKEPEDDPLVDLTARCGVAWFRGPTEDVLGRMLGALEGQAVDVALRVTADDILVDPEYVDRAVRCHLEVNAEYSDLKALPSGTEVEVFDVALLRDLWTAARDSDGTEYLTTYIVNHRDQFRTNSVPVDEGHARRWRLTLDTPEDYQVIGTFLEAMRSQGKGLNYRLDDIVRFFSGRPEVLAINAQVGQRQTPPEVCTDLDWRRLA